MKTIVQTYQEKFSKIQSRNQRFFICMLALSIVVVIFVFYNLRSMGIAQVNEVPENIADVADISANVEVASIWEETLPDDAELDGETYAEDIVLIAQSQLGYEESTTNFALADDGSHYGYTRYGEWLGNPYLEKWDAAFVSFCLYYAGVSEDDYPYNSGTFAWVAQLDEEEYFLTVEEHTPEIGDLIFFDTIGDESPDTMGIVTEILAEDETESGEPEIKVIQGDYDDAVAEVSYFVASPTIVGYAELPEKPDEDTVLIATPVTSTEAIESYSISMETDDEEDSDVDDTQFVTYDDVEIETLASTDSDSKYARTNADQYPTTIPDAWAEQGYAIYTCTTLGGGTSVNNSSGIENYGFWIWLYDETDNPLFSSAAWEGSDFTINTYIYDVLTNGDSYYIPLYYFTGDDYGKISIDDYDIDFGICPFEYAPDPTNTVNRVTTTSYTILTFEEKNYVYVKLDSLTLGSYAPARVNIYYTGETITPIVGDGSTNVGGLYMWAYATENNITGAVLDDNNGKVGGYSRWSDNGDIDKGIGVSGSTYSYTAYQYTANGEYCYLVPVEYFRLLYDTQDKYYKTDATDWSIQYGVNWTYDPDEPCPFYYDPNSNEDASSSTFTANHGTTKAEYVFADFEGTGTDKCYVLLKTTQYYNDYGWTQPRFFVFYYTDFTMGEYVVTFSLGNENGYVLDTNYNYDYYDYNFWGITDSRTDSVFGGPQKDIEGRWFSKPLIDYADENGIVTINLPSDSNLIPRLSLAEYAEDGWFTVVSGNGSTLPDINMIFPEELNYDWKLIGWTNVITGEYYDVSNGATTADITLYDENGNPIYNVFYADWIAANYDYGSSDDTNLGGLDPNVVDTSSFVSIKMFDYSETFNLYSTNMEQTLSEENWSDANTFASDLGGNYIDGGETTDFGSFLFVNNASYNESNQALGYPHDKRYGNVWVGPGKIAGTENLGIQNTDKGFLNILFDTDNETNAHGVYYVGNANYLFELNDSTYTFDSRSHGAVYNQADQRFYVYNNPMYNYYYYATQNSKNGIFLPYNDPSWSYGSSEYKVPSETKDMLDIHNGSTNYWFGMQIDVDFYNYGTGSNCDDLTFKFYGDDDVWIFIDDKLVVDLSGIHDSEYAILNFTQSTIQIGMTDNLTDIEDGIDSSSTVQLPVNGGCQNLADLGSADGNTGTTYLQNYMTNEVHCFVDTTTLDDENLGAGQHHLTLYYLERGAWESNLHLEFNLIPNWQYATDSATAISVRKKWINLDGNEVDTSDLVAKVGLFAKVADAESAMDETGTYYVTTIDDVDYYVDATDPENPIQLEIGDEGLVYDANGDIVAYYANNVATYLKGNVEDGALYLYVSEVELNSDNAWNASWRAIVNGPEYILLELEHNWNYYATALTKVDFSDENETESYQYWHVVGEADIEALIQDKQTNNNIEYSITYDEDTTLYYYEPTPILITDAGYNTAIPGKIGIQAEVLRNQTDTSGVLTTEFLNISARPETIDNVDYFGLIDNRDVTNDVIWYLQGVSDTASDDTTGADVHMFYIFYYGEDGNRYYLNANEKDDNTAPTTLTATMIEASVSYNGDSYPNPYKNVLEFYYSNIGELFITIGGGGDYVDDTSTPYNYKVIFDQNGSVTLTADGVSKLDPQNARIYMLAAEGEIETSGYTYILSNQESVGVLPEAGGSGIAIYLIVGGGVIAVAAVLLIRRRRAT